MADHDQRQQQQDHDPEQLNYHGKDKTIIRKGQEVVCRSRWQDVPRWRCKRQGKPRNATR